MVSLSSAYWGSSHAGEACRQSQKGVLKKIQTSDPRAVRRDQALTVDSCHETKGTTTKIVRRRICRVVSLVVGDRRTGFTS